ncbi:ABC transporter ATP-binding protein [Spirochaetia bacterium]|nr:ABC transporter ATP-binding protein [Spirochaetia bacterium]
MPMLEVKNISKQFKVASGDLYAVDNVSFTIEKGETLGIVGESGCGKSTLGRVLLRLHEPSSGRIWFNDMDITSFSRQEMRQLRRHMQIIFQDPYASLNPRLSIAQIIGEPLQVYRVCKNSAERREKVLRLMDMVGLSERSYNAYPHEFDGGRRQRVVIARALALNPDFVVCDEPVSALDVSVQAQILNLMMDLQKELNLTYMFISHDLSVVKHISNHVGVMYLGRLVERAPKNEIFQNPAHPYTKALLQAIPSMTISGSSGAPEQKIILSGEISSPVNVKSGCRFAARCPFAVEACSGGDSELREISPGHFVACARYEDIGNA